MPEIEDDELIRLRGAEKLMNELIGSPKTAQSTQRAIKELHPEYLTERDRAEPFIKEAKEEAEKVLKEHLKKTKEDHVEAEFQRKLDSYRLSASNPDGYTDEGIEKIKNLMRERTIPDVDAAAALFEKLNPQNPETPSGYRETGWNFARADKDDKDSKLLFEDPDAWADAEARKVWDEERRKANAA